MHPVSEWVSEREREREREREKEKDRKREVMKQNLLCISYILYIICYILYVNTTK